MEGDRGPRGPGFRAVSWGYSALHAAPMKPWGRARAAANFHFTKYDTDHRAQRAFIGHVQTKHLQGQTHRHRASSGGVTRRFWNHGVVMGAVALKLETADTVPAMGCIFTTRGREEPEPSLSISQGLCEDMRSTRCRRPPCRACFGLNYSYSLQRTQEI